MSDRYFVDHDTIHDRITGQHVELEEAAGMLSVEPEAMQRIAWGVVVGLGAKLKNAEADRDQLASDLAAARSQLDEFYAATEGSPLDVFRQLLHVEGELSNAVGELEHLKHTSEDEAAELGAERDAAIARAEKAEQERDEFIRECNRLREVADTALISSSEATKRDTVERIAAWLESRRDGNASYAMHEKLLAADIRAHAWRKEDGK